MGTESILLLNNYLNTVLCFLEEAKLFPSS